METWFELDSSRFFLTESDKIYHWEFYDPPRRKRFYTPSTSLILDLKKNDPSNPYYKKAFSKATGIIKNFFESLDLSELTIVPIPSSECVDNFDADFVLSRLLEKAGLSEHVQNLFCFKKVMPKTHLSNNPRNPEIFINNLSINIERLRECKQKIFIFDDVLTSGAHFSACKTLILENREDADVKGVMLTVTRISNSDSSF